MNLGIRDAYHTRRHEVLDTGQGTFHGLAVHIWYVVVMWAF